ncbi:MAG: ATP-binding cassette domain-containing protein, partial [bacterium]
MNEYVIEMNNITKKFKGIIANDNVTLKLKKGEIHALLGENGAGKSTLMSVLFGLYEPEEGEILMNGNVVKINNPNDANDLGIGMVHQHFKLVDVFTVLENIMLGAETVKNGILDKKTSYEKIMSISNKYGLKINPDSLISNITVGMQQRVEILKMLYRDNEVLIFDEPTAVLTPAEIDELMTIMKNFAKEGKSILFITHKLNEIKEVANRCTILRKGKYVTTVDVKDTSKEELSRLMVGRDIEVVENKSNTKVGNVILDVKDLSVYSSEGKKNIVENINFNVKQGEIVCITGIDGNGQTELIYGLTGLQKVSSGQVVLNGEDITKS